MLSVNCDATNPLKTVATTIRYRVMVRRNWEKKFCEYFLSARYEDKWRSVIMDAYYPTTEYVKIKAKALAIATKPLVPGMIYLKSKMSPEIADSLENYNGIYGFAKNMHGLVLPLREEEAKDLEISK